MIIYVHPKCSTCKEALAFLKNHSVTYIEKDILKETPSITELKKMLSYQEEDMKKLFNTSGLLYKEMGLKNKLPLLDQDQALELLASNGMLIKRPFLIGKDYGLVGFKKSIWEKTVVKE
jgi:Spx/MgsR family transcriptional regulator